MALKAGTENKKKLWILAGLVMVAAAVFATNLLPGGDSAPRSSNRSVLAAPNAGSVPAADARAGATRRRGNATRNVTDFQPVIGPKGPDDKRDTSGVDPTLRTDLLAKLQGVDVEGSSRNLFQVGAEPVKAVAALPKEPKIPINKTPAPPPPPPGPVVAEKPHAPPVTFKYYGFTDSKASARKKAFFLDGEDIIVASEGDTVKRRYKIVKIGVNSVTIEDTQFHESQTLPLTPPETNG